MVEGHLVKQSDGRYKVDDFVLYSGSLITYFDEEEQAFIELRIEYSDGDYYIVVLGREESIEDIQARIKREG